MNAEVIRHVDSIARDKNITPCEPGIQRTSSRRSVRPAQSSSTPRTPTEFSVNPEPGETGDISLVSRHGQSVAAANRWQRIAAQTAKQVMIQLFRQDERGSIYEEFKDRVGTIVTGTVARFEGGSMIVTLGRAEGIMPRSEQIPGEVHQVGERVQALVLEVRDTASAVKIILSRSHAEMIRRLFEREVPEVGERTIELKALAREPGHRTKIAVSSIDSKVDAVGACVGGARKPDQKHRRRAWAARKSTSSAGMNRRRFSSATRSKPAEVTEVALLKLRTWAGPPWW